MVTRTIRDESDVDFEEITFLYDNGEIEWYNIKSLEYDLLINAGSDALGLKFLNNINDENSIVKFVAINRRYLKRMELVYPNKQK